MAKQTVNLGVVPDGVGGDDVRTGFTKVNDNFTELYTTPTQEEAEAGTSQVVKGWTAQRIRQGITAWFTGISGAIGRTILGRSTAEQVRADLELGTAATKDVGTSVGNVMEVGAFGLGASPANGQIRSWVLPQFSFGLGDISDEYLVLFPSAVGGAHGIKGEFHNSRGSAGAGNISSVQSINAQTAYSSNFLSSWVNGKARYIRFSILSISGVEYVAMKAELINGPSDNQNVFYGNVIGGDSRLFTRVRESDSNVTLVSDNVGSVAHIYHTSNTTINPDGTLKASSPVINLYTDKHDLHNDSQFGATPTVVRKSKGVYEITGTLGMRSEGWYLDTPSGLNGNKYFNIEWTQNITPDAVNGVVDEYRDDIVVTIETFERVWNKDTGMFDNGDPMDINDLQERFVQLRFNEIKVEHEELDDEAITRNQE